MAVRAKKKRGDTEDRYLSLEFNVNGKSIYYAGDKMTMDEVAFFKALTGVKMPITVSHTGQKDKRHRVDNIEMPPVDEIVQITTDKVKHSTDDAKEFNIVVLERHLRERHGTECASSYVPTSTFLTDSLSPLERFKKLHN